MSTTISGRSFGPAKVRRLVAAALLLFLPTSCSSCRNDSASGVGSAAGPSADPAPVADPAGLMAELRVMDPDGTWRKLREQAGSRAALLPTSFPMLASTLLDLPHTAAGMFDAKVPALGVLIADASGSSAAWVLGLHVKSGRELAAALTNGADASHSARTDAASGVLLLEAKSKKDSSGPALGIVDNYLLVAERVEPLTTAGPFVARTLPRRPATPGPVVLTLPQQALAGPVAKYVQKFWRQSAAELKALDQKNRQDRGGRTPDFGDPLAALNGVAAAVDTTVELLKSARELRVVLEPLDDGLELRAELTPAQDGPAAEVVKELVVGDVEPLLTLPKHTLVGVLSRGSSSQRETSASSGERLRALFGERLSAADKILIDETFAQLARGRGDFAAYGLVEEGGGLCAVMRGAAGDVNAFNSGLKSLLKFPRVRAFSEPLRQFVGELTVRSSSTAVPGLSGRVDRAALTVKPARMRLSAAKAGAPEAESFDLLWRAEGQHLFLALGRDAAPSLVGLVHAPAEKTLAADAFVSRAARRAGPVSFAVVLRPLALAMTDDPALERMAPVFIAVGRERGGMRVRASAQSRRGRADSRGVRAVARGLAKRR